MCNKISVSMIISFLKITYYHVILNPILFFAFSKWISMYISKLKKEIILFSNFVPNHVYYIVLRMYCNVPLNNYHKNSRKIVNMARQSKLLYVDLCLIDGQGLQYVHSCCKTLLQLEQRILRGYFLRCCLFKISYGVNVLK